MEKDLNSLNHPLYAFSSSRTESALSVVNEIVPVIEQVRKNYLPNLLFAYGGRAFVEEPSLHDLFKNWIYFGDNFATKRAADGTVAGS